MEKNVAQVIIHSPVIKIKQNNELVHRKLNSSIIGEKISFNSNSESNFISSSFQKNGESNSLRENVINNIVVHDYSTIKNTAMKKTSPYYNLNNANDIMITPLQLPKKSTIIHLSPAHRKIIRNK